MQYALVDGQRQEPSPGAKGECEMCGAPALAKCGPKVMHHWAHAGRRNCDPWWENETEWHRSWKNLFPPECREVCHTASGGEIHRADIKTPGGLYIEIQHSAMSEAERTSREQFYKNLVWIVDARGFKDRFHLHHMLPDPDLEWAQDLAWARPGKPPDCFFNGQFFRYSLIAEDEKVFPGGGLHEVFSLDRIRAEVEEGYVGHHQYVWQRPPSTWLNATCPVYLDFGEEWLVRLEIYPVGNLPCAKLLGRDLFVEDLLTVTDAKHIFP